MMRSLYSGVTGLRSHQTKMDVVGTNIANVNTVGFKASRVTFRDTLYQTMTGATQGTATRGGNNPYQIGYGAQISSIDTQNTRAGYQMTDQPFDFYIDGEGYFQVEDNNGLPHFTRVGRFGFDTAGNLVDANGSKVYGLNAEWVAESGTPGTPAYVPAHYELNKPIVDKDTPTNEGTLEPITITRLGNYSSLETGKDGKISGINKDTGEREVLAQIAVFAFGNDSGLSQVGSTYLDETPNSGAPQKAEPGTLGTGGLVGNGLEMSNVDLAKEFTDMITTQRGFQANSRIITVSDEMLQELVNLKR